MSGLVKRVKWRSYHFNKLISLVACQMKEKIRRPTVTNHKSIIGQGSAQWNLARKKQCIDKPLLAKCRLKGLFLRKANLQNADLKGACCIETDFANSDFHGADLRLADFSSANVSGVNFSGCDMRSARFRRAQFDGATLVACDLREADLRDADFTNANLTGANLEMAMLQGAVFRKSCLRDSSFKRADLRMSRFLECDLTNADISSARVYGASTWGLVLDGTRQSELIITEPPQAVITVDSIDIAQLMYLLLTNKKVRDVIDSVTAKLVLILGRFTPERKRILDRLRLQFASLDLVPVMFDFDIPESRDTTETVSLLAHLARFVVADITDAKSVPQELGRIVPQLPSVPVQPILYAGEKEYGMFDHFKRYPWVLPVIRYDNSNEDIIVERIIKALTLAISR